MDKSFHSQNFKGGFSPSKYEELIQEMNAVKWESILLMISFA